MSPLPSRGLYAITDGPRNDLFIVAEQALRGGAQWLQYRDKTHDLIRRQSEASALCQLCHQHGAKFIVNDDIALACTISADGVHLGKDDQSIDAARTNLGEGAIIGVSCYDSMNRARAAKAAGADYIAFGAFFPSPTKPQAARAIPALLRESAQLGLPRVAVGGITEDNAPQLVAAGADWLAVISALFQASNVYATAQHFAQLYANQREHP